VSIASLRNRIDRADPPPVARCPRHRIAIYLLPDDWRTGMPEPEERPKGRPCRNCGVTTVVPVEVIEEVVEAAV
jgi:hypothetical protein